MNCCGHNNEDKKQGHKHISHIWMMALCCGIPILLILLLQYIGKFLPGVSLALGSIIPFLCPVMMIGMMLMIHRNGRNENRDESRDYHMDVK